MAEHDKHQPKKKWQTPDVEHISSGIKGGGNQPNFVEAGNSHGQHYISGGGTRLPVGTHTYNSYHS